MRSGDLRTRRNFFNITLRKEILAYHHKYTSKIKSNFPPNQTQQKVFQCTFFCLETVAVALHKKSCRDGFCSRRRRVEV